MTGASSSKPPSRRSSAPAADASRGGRSARAAGTSSGSRSTRPPQSARTARDSKQAPSPKEQSRSVPQVEQSIDVGHIKTARDAAAAALLRVWQQDAYAAAALSSILNASALEPRDRGLATELTYGVLRTEPYLERLLASRGKIKKSDLIMRAHLWLAAYQLCFLSKVPAHAAVDEAVRAVKRSRGQAGAGFANGLLRNLARDLPQLEIASAIFESTPSWLRKRLLRDVGEEAAQALLAPSESPRPTLRFLRSITLPEWALTECSPVVGVPGAYLYHGGGDPRRKPEFLQGHFFVQELGAQVVGHALGTQPGERVLDVCAGRGQKTLLLQDALGPGGRLVATDLHPHKVSALLEQVAGDQSRVEARVWDWTQPAPSEWHGAFDRVLVDAPCTGVGTLRRRPEILRRLTASDPQRLASLQLQIVRNAAQTLCPGGTLLVATCSVLAEEGPLLVQKIVDELGLRPMTIETEVDDFLRKGLRPFAMNSPEEDGEDAPVSSVSDGRKRELLPAMTLLPTTHGTDGYFIARFMK